MKRIIWIGNTYQTILSFPKGAKQITGYNLDRVQRGLEPSDWKPMTSVGKGVKEIRIHTQNEYRVIYTANFEEGIYILHALIKKTQKTSQKDIDIAKQRFKEVINNRGDEHA